MQPVILVTTDRRDGGPPATGQRRVRPRRAEAWLVEPYIEAVRNAGGLPLLLPPGPTDIAALLEIASGVVLTGGHFDIHPSWYGQAVSGRLDRVEEGRTSLELALARACMESETPVLGICGGMQALAVAAGGTLVQDIASQVATTIDHEQLSDPAEPWHKVRFAPSVHHVFDTVAHVNSTHHQAVLDPGALSVAGRAEDGVIEAIVGDGPGFILGVQWHPELLGDIRPYRALVEACRRG